MICLSLTCSMTEKKFALSEKYAFSTLLGYSTIVPRFRVTAIALYRNALCDFKYTSTDISLPLVLRICAAHTYNIHV